MTSPRVEKNQKRRFCVILLVQKTGVKIQDGDGIFAGCRLRDCGLPTTTAGEQGIGFTPALFETEEDREGAVDQPRKGEVGC